MVRGTESEFWLVHTEVRLALSLPQPKVNTAHATKSDSINRIMADLQRGVWAAVVTYTDGTKERLACIHEDLLFSEGTKQFYQTTFSEDQSKARTLINLLREKKRAIVTESAHHSDGSLILPRNRIAYTGVVSIDDIIASGDPLSLRFQITGRYARGQKTVPR